MKDATDVLRILTCEEVRQAEQRAVEHGGSLWDLMRRAGEACAQAVGERYPGHAVIVLAGPGNNGGDAFVAAGLLARPWRKVVVYELAGATQSEDRARASAAWTGERWPLSQFKPADLSHDCVVLDGLFGAGLSRPLSGEAAAAAAGIRTRGAPVVAIDVPSGVAGDRGEVEGTAVRAHVTVTFGAKKPAHLLLPAAWYCGEVHVADIGLIPPPPEGHRVAHENAPALWADVPPWPSQTAHKYSRGSLGVVTGPMASTGAARLAAHAGLRVGAGVATLLCPPDALAVAAGSVTALLTRSFEGAADLARLADRMKAAVIGPAAGVGPATRENVIALARAGPCLVLDADALSVFAGEPEALASALDVDTGAGHFVLTPHVGEFERLFPHLLGKSLNRIEAAREAARITGATVLLKGPDTVIADPWGRAVVNTHATPFLATAGSGDVLAGVIGGLMAQGVDMFSAACAGAWMHGDAGIRAGPGMTAEDLDLALKQTIAALYAERHRTVT